MKILETVFDKNKHIDKVKNGVEKINQNISLHSFFSFLFF